jgi:serine-type D-Ala-D-Ala carboxypeptidase
LSHSSGLAAWKPFFEGIIEIERAGRTDFIASQAAKTHVLELVHREKPVSQPGTKSLYSDLGFMVLAETVELITGVSLDRFCQDRLFKPLGLRSTGFVDLAQLRTRRVEPAEEMIAATENCPWRKKVLCGEVHDDNAYVMGGVAGHAGLFSSARDIHDFIIRMDRCRNGMDDFLPQALVQEFLTKDNFINESTFALGWDTPSPTRSSSGNLFSARSAGHLGFTGCSIWWDMEKNAHVILLTNRVHPSRENEKIKDFRPHLHDLIMKTLFP